MITYREFLPTCFDVAGLGCQGRQHWLVAPCGTNRDADALTRANFDALRECLAEVDPTGDDHEIYRFGHWANGWFELVLVRPGSAAAAEAESCEAALADYPVLSENLFSDYENEETMQAWRHARLKERIEWCSRAGVSIFAARRDDMPAECFQEVRDSL